MQDLRLRSNPNLESDRHTLWPLVLLRVSGCQSTTFGGQRDTDLDIGGKMYSRRGFEGIEVPGLQERSGPLLFVQVGRGIMSLGVD